MQPVLSAMLVDDHPLFRNGLKSILAAMPELEVVAEAATAREALELARELKPALVFLDISLPDATGLQIIEDLRALSPECKVCILSMHAKVYFVTEAFKAGASAYLLKESAAEILVDAVRIVLAGQRYIDPALIKKVFAHSPLLNPAAANPNSLSKREEEVLRLVAQGFTTKTIGEALHISHKTVEKHRSNILERLGLHNSVELVRYALEVGLISLNE